MRATMKTSFLRTGAALVLAVGVATPAAAQIDFSNFVQIGDSLTGGFVDGCWVEHGQRDSYGAILARQAGAPSFEQPLIKEPGLGPCITLLSLAPTFGAKTNTGVPLNLNLARPYNNLAVPGYNTKDVVSAHSSADASNRNALTDLVLRGSGATVLQQAASLKPSFVTIFIGNNDILGAAGVGVALEGVTLTTKASFTANLQTIVDTMKAAQSGTAKGVLLNLGDVTSIPFTTTISPYIPGTNNTVTFLGRKSKPDPATGLNTGFEAVAPIPATSLVTLRAAALLATGTGIPCAVLDAGGVPASDIRRTNCNTPLPDGHIELDLTTTPPSVKLVQGVVLYPDEVAAMKARNVDFNTAISTIGAAAGYKVFDVKSVFTDIVAKGRSYGGITIRTGFLSGGFFGYDGVHPTSIGYALFTIDFIKFLNASFGTSIPQPDLYPFFANGNAQTGGFPAVVEPTQDQIQAYAAEVYSDENWEAGLKDIFRVQLPTAAELLGHEPVQTVVPAGGRAVTRRP